MMFDEGMVGNTTSTSCLQFAFNEDVQLPPSVVRWVYAVLALAPTCCLPLAFGGAVPVATFDLLFGQGV